MAPAAVRTASRARSGWTSTNTPSASTASPPTTASIHETPAPNGRCEAPPPTVSSAMPSLSRLRPAGHDVVVQVEHVVGVVPLFERTQPRQRVLAVCALHARLAVVRQRVHVRAG